MRRFVKLCTTAMVYHITCAECAVTRQKQACGVHRKLAFTAEWNWNRLSCQQCAFRKCFVDVPEYYHSITITITRLLTYTCASIFSIILHYLRISRRIHCTCLHWLSCPSSHGETPPQSQSQRQPTGRLQRTLGRTIKQKQLCGISGHGPVR
jgi:hypothetical protein